jgi:hypothetical protein
MSHAIADPVIWVNEHNPMITSLSVNTITFFDEVRSPLHNTIALPKAKMIALLV